MRGDVFRPMPAERPADCLLPGALAALGLPPVPAYPPVPDEPPGTGYPALPPYLSARHQPAPPGWPPRATRGYLALRAVLGYLTMPLAVVPVLIYLSTLRGPRWARAHAAQAVNVWFTGILYDLSAVIMGAMLALDSAQAALIVFAPLVAARWAVTLSYLVRAARAASQGADYTVPSWLCVRAAR